LVAEDRGRFLDKAKAEGVTFAVLDVPLLFETSHERGFDAVVVVSAPFDIQRARVLARPGMTLEKFEAILAKQIPDAEKRRRADYVVATGKPLEDTRRDVAAIVEDLKRRFGSDARRPDGHRRRD
jgi:dephospho-CoA kinase